ncbi:NYN domain-containing protein [Luteimonas sp. MC1782]|uniref:NYN domain-containing protein n=1 Tax=Luteimonas sp. MC1782 TaxID=2760305 RepID=UPI00160367FF|nr:NYN domain-containing protein [Luteimonas sp. MC1782]MBB1473985.1 NYN domain-containing protein [Luteimonas sp. MC1782]
MTNNKLAVLIDSDNAQAAIAQELLNEVARYGTATVKRAYGDWTTTNLSGWKETLHSLAIQPIQQFRFTVGKNATDSALIIDAMDLLHSGGVDGFCLVSSDSDFTRLATRIREAGLAVYGFGERKTPKPFVAACDKFIFTEILRTSSPEKVQPEPTQESLHTILVPAIAAAAREDGWAALSAVGNLATKSHPSFDSRNYGCQKLSELIRKQKFLDTKSVASSDGSPNVHYYVRVKET